LWPAAVASKYREERKVEPIFPSTNELEHHEDEVYNKIGQVKNVRKRSGRRLSVKA
jgi:predicted Zn-ribbon and HTH transcriptional regulator